LSAEPRPGIFPVSRFQSEASTASVRQNRSPTDQLPVLKAKTSFFVPLLDKAAHIIGHGSAVLLERAGVSSFWVVEMNRFVSELQ